MEASIMRGRLGTTRYIDKRETTITRVELETMISRLEDPRLKALSVLSFYTGLRLAELVGDTPRKWKILNHEGKRLQTIGELPGRPEDREWMRDPNLWEWRYRDPLPGLVKEDVRVQGDTVYIISKPLKHGKRKHALELPVDLPYMNLVIDIAESTEPKERVFPFSENQVWRAFTKAGNIYPHAFRYSRATNMAKTPGMALKDLMGWFGWARSATADAYLTGEESIAKARDSITQSMKEVEK
jgi:integrase